MSAGGRGLPEKGSASSEGNATAPFTVMETARIRMAPMLRVRPSTSLARAACRASGQAGWSAPEEDAGLRAMIAQSLSKLKHLRKARVRASDLRVLGQRCGRNWVPRRAADTSFRPP